MNIGTAKQELNVPVKRNRFEFNLLTDVKDVKKTKQASLPQYSVRYDSTTSDAISMRRHDKVKPEKSFLELNQNDSDPDLSSSTKELGLIKAICEFLEKPTSEYTFEVAGNLLIELYKNDKGPRLSDLKDLIKLQKAYGKNQGTIRQQSIPAILRGTLYRMVKQGEMGGSVRSLEEILEDVVKEYGAVMM